MFSIGENLHIIVLSRRPRTHGDLALPHPINLSMEKFISFNDALNTLYLLFANGANY